MNPNESSCRGGCGDVVERPGGYCYECKHRRRRIRARERERRRLNGLCACCDSKSLPGDILCQDHMIRQAKSAFGLKAKSILEVLMGKHDHEWRMANIRPLGKAEELERVWESALKRNGAILTHKDVSRLCREVLVRLKPPSELRIICPYCAPELPTFPDGVPLAFIEVDHIWPKKLNGSDSVDNKEVVCMVCNHRKGSALLSVEQVRERNRQYRDMMTTP